jgi:hypothetical protein
MTAKIKLFDIQLSGVFSGVSLVNVLKSPSYPKHSCNSKISESLVT